MEFPRPRSIYGRLPGEAIKPEKIIGSDLIIVDQLQRPYPAISTVDFGPVMLVDQIPKG